MDALKVQLACMAVALLLPFTALAAEKEKTDTGSADFQWVPLQLSFWKDTAVFDTRAVHGVRLNFVYGYEERLRGLDLGAVNTTDDLVGLQMGLVYNRADRLRGIQLAGLGNYSGDTPKTSSAFKLAPPTGAKN